MSEVEFVNSMLPIIFPRFFTATDENMGELVILKTGKVFDRINLKEIGFRSRTEYEGFENHFHLFDNIDREELPDAINIGEKISRHLLLDLYREYPNKEFIVYMNITHENSMIIRFHQIWENELLFYDTECQLQEETMLYEYR